MNPLSEVEKAYFAGIFDGEGCIYISKFQKKPVNVSIVYLLSVRLTQNDKSFLEYWQRKLGIGGVYKLNAANSFEETRGHVFVVGSRQAVDLLNCIYPYLILKKEQALVAFEFQSLSLRGKQSRGMTVPPWITEKREELYWRIRELKGNGREETRGRKRVNKDLYLEQE